VLHKGSPGDHLLFLLRGHLQVIDVTEDGREVGLNFLKPGDYFGEFSIIDDLPRSASVVALETSSIALLPKAHAKRLFFGSPTVAEQLLRQMTGRLRSASSFRSLLSIPSAPQRVFALLQDLCREAPGGLIVIDSLPTQHKIAIMVNTSRESVSRAIQVLLQQGIVERDLRRLIVRRPDVLKTLATASPSCA